MSIDVSIIVCTNRGADKIAPTIASIQRVEPPPGLKLELIVVDNSRDHGLSGLSLDEGRLFEEFRCLSEPQPGTSRARNLGIRASRGKAIVFSDDDLEVPTDWVRQMATPIIEGESDAVAGQVKIAPDLVRPWMDRYHRAFFAEFLTAETPPYQGMVGASMAIASKVFETVPGFDEELGPGGLGTSEEDLLARQMNEAGFRLVCAAGPPSIHHFDRRRLLRTSMLREASMKGVSMAYLHHHWLHQDDLGSWAARARVRAVAALALTPRGSDTEGCSERILWNVFKLARLRALRRLAGTPRNYDPKGLRKVRSSGLERGGR